MKNKLLIVYNCCGISGLETLDLYKKSIDSILSQTILKDGSCQLIISGCAVSAEMKYQLMDYYCRDGVSYCWIEDRLAVNITFNKVVEEGIKRWGKFHGYLYSDMGISCQTPNDIENLFELHCSGPYAMSCSRVTCDDGLWAWFQLGKWHDDYSEHEEFFKNGPV